jgi:hypothetical protein
VSAVFKGIGKVFSKIVKTVVKIAPFALAAAAVVFTGGAALGILPTFSAAVGGLVSSLGLSAGITGALTGAVTSAGFGAALGFVTGGKKGLQKGALMGALTGGVLGMVSPTTFGIVNGPNGVTTTHALASAAAQTASKVPLTSSDTAPQVLDKLPGGLTSGATNAAASAAPLANVPNNLAAPSIPNFTTATAQAAPAAAPAGTLPATGGIAPAASINTPALPDTSSFFSTSPNVTAANSGIAAIQNTTGGIGGIPASGTSATGTGILDSILKNPTMVGSVLSALGNSNSKVSAKDLQKEVDAQVQLKQRMGALAYGGDYAGKSDPFGVGNSGYNIPQPRYYYDPQAKTVVDRQAQGA